MKRDASGARCAAQLTAKINALFVWVPSRLAELCVAFLSLEHTEVPFVLNSCLSKAAFQEAFFALAL
jgi:hypothetical protein